MHKKKRILILLILMVFFGIYINISVYACTPGEILNGGPCGKCGTLQQVCQSNCQYGTEDCVNKGICDKGTTECRGDHRYICDNTCQWIDIGCDKACGCSVPGTDGGELGFEFCGNNVCAQGESCSSCPSDCGTCPEPCGNGVCGPGESNSNCPQDCPLTQKQCDISNWDGWKVDSCWDENGNANCNRIQDAANWWCQNRCDQQKALSYSTSWVEGIGTKYVPTGRVCPTCSMHFSSLTCGRCASNEGQQCNCNAFGCGGTIQCDGRCSGSMPCASNRGQSCGNCGTIDCSGSCTNQGPCSPGQTQCSGGRYQSCSGSCQWQNSGTDADNDGTDRQCGDSQCDNSQGVFDSTKTATESSCTDGLDNDCDAKTDCNDTECDGSIIGTVKSDNKPIAQADINAKKDLTLFKSTTTNNQGSYSMGINCGTYNLVASHPDYAPKTVSNLNIPPKQQVTQDFNLVIGTACESDCTYASDEIVHAECNGKNGCSFFNDKALEVCNNAQPGWVREYNATHYVICPFGSPQSNIEIEASVSCESGTLIKMTRIVVYNGKPVKLVVVTCG